ncbi:hypothetical protein ABH925_006664 [Streptacidiphilus sp. EB129]
MLAGAGTTIRVTHVETFEPQPFTVLGWVVPDIARVMTQLAQHAVEFVVFEGIGQDADGLWTAPGGHRIAWFKDPDANLLSPAQYACPSPVARSSAFATPPAAKPPAVTATELDRVLRFCWVGRASRQVLGGRPAVPRSVQLHRPALPSPPPSDDSQSLSRGDERALRHVEERRRHGHHGLNQSTPPGPTRATPGRTTQPTINLTTPDDSLEAKLRAMGHYETQARSIAKNLRCYPGTLLTELRTQHLTRQRAAACGRALPPRLPAPTASRRSPGW